MVTPFQAAYFVFTTVLFEKENLPVDLAFFSDNFSAQDRQKYLEYIRWKDRDAYPYRANILKYIIDRPNLTRRILQIANVALRAIQCFTCAVLFFPQASLAGMSTTALISTGCLVLTPFVTKVLNHNSKGVWIADSIAQRALYLAVFIHVATKSILAGLLMGLGVLTGNLLSFKKEHLDSYWPRKLFYALKEKELSGNEKTIDVKAALQEIKQFESSHTDKALSPYHENIVRCESHAVVAKYHQAYLGKEQEAIEGKIDEIISELHSVSPKSTQIEEKILSPLWHVAQEVDKIWTLEINLFKRYVNMSHNGPLNDLKRWNVAQWTNLKNKFTEIHNLYQTKVIGQVLKEHLNKSKKTTKERNLCIRIADPFYLQQAPALPLVHKEAVQSRLGELFAVHQTASTSVKP